VSGVDIVKELITHDLESQQATVGWCELTATQLINGQGGNCRGRIRGGDMSWSLNFEVWH